MITAYQDIYSYLESKGLKPQRELWTRLTETSLSSLSTIPLIAV
jgi:hypothetical protein